jgi:pimeloyl-ACP methyl ester carboxylesterase
MDLFWAPEANARELVVGPDRLFMLEQGSGVPVLLLHGYSCELTHFRYQLPFLAKAGFRTIALDLPGHGHADKPRGPYPARRFLDSIVGAMDALGISKAHIVGHSMGATAALALAQHHPERVDKLALIGPYADGMPLGPAFGAWVRVLARIPLVRDLVMGLNNRAGFESSLGAAIHDVKKTLSVDGGRWLDYGWEMFNVPGMRRVYVASAADFISGWRKLLPLPPRLGERALIIWGRHDGITLYEGAPKVVEMTGAKLLTLDVGHCCHFEAPDAVNAALLAHLQPASS